MPSIIRWEKLAYLGKFVSIDETKGQAMKEEPAFRTMEKDGLGPLGHDDKLIIRMWKDDKRAGAGDEIQKGVGLAEGWKAQVPELWEHGRKVVSQYWNGKTKPDAENMKPDDWDALDLTVREAKKREGWRTVYVRGMELADRVNLVMSGFNVEIRLCDLYEKATESRYGMAINHLTDLVNQGVIAYAPRVAEPTRKNKWNAVRNRLLDAFVMMEYEHNILFPGYLGRRMLAEFNELDNKRIHRDGGSTVYLQGYVKSKDRQKKVKLYDVGAREGLAQGERFKLETTFFHPFFRDKGIKINALTLQPIIQEMIVEELVDTVAHVINLLSEETQDMLADAVNVDTRDRRKMPRGIAEAMLRPERTMSARVDALERDMRAVKRDQEAIKRRLDKAGL